MNQRLWQTAVERAGRLAAPLAFRRIGRPLRVPRPADGSIAPGMEHALTPTQKGNVAEAAITAAAVKLGIGVLRPTGDGYRYDLVFDVGDRFLHGR